MGILKLVQLVGTKFRPEIGHTHIFGMFCMIFVRNVGIMRVYWVNSICGSTHLYAGTVAKLQGTLKIESFYHGCSSLPVQLFFQQETASSIVNSSSSLNICWSYVQVYYQKVKMRWEDIWNKLFCSKLLGPGLQKKVILKREENLPTRSLCQLGNNQVTLACGSGYIAATSLTS